MSIQTKLLSIITKAKTKIPNSETILVAVSGGGDSVALLRLLTQLAPKYDWHLIAAHVDHGIRSNSIHDAQFVQNLTKYLGVTYLSQRVQISYDNYSPEEASRQARQKALINMATKVQAKIIALGHNIDDQAETLLMRLFTGTGLTGLASMHILNSPWWRPLLTVRRQTLRNYLITLDQTWREDTSNNELTPIRNRIRNIILPLIENEINPKVIKALSRLANLAMKEEKHWLSWCKKTLTTHAWREGPSICLEIFYLLKQNIASQRRLVRYAITLLLRTNQHLSAYHVEQVLKLAQGQSGRQLHLSNTLTVWRENRFFHQDCLRLDTKKLLAYSWVYLNGPSCIWLPSLNLWLIIKKKFGLPELKTRGIKTWIPLKQINWPLIVRPYLPREHFQAFGAPGSKPINQFLKDIKIPIWWRQRTLVMADQQGPLWIIPWAIAERARYNKDTIIQQTTWLTFYLVDRDNDQLYTYSNLFRQI